MLSVAFDRSVSMFDGSALSPTRERLPLRGDIEGLRAVAVLGVVANHVNPSYLQGGFAGVDIFFVISGYLIGMHLLQDISAGQFSFLRFYARRARRLLPALVLVLSAVFAFGWLILSPSELVALGNHVAAATLFSNNILLWSESGYFDAPSATKPLLHLWSLAVEEQFYLLVPLLLWLGSRGRHASIAWVARLSAASFLLMELSVAPSFYLLSTRFWELGVGVALGSLALNASCMTAGTGFLTRNAYREIVGWVVLLIFATTLLLGSVDREVQAWLATCGALLAPGLAILTAQACGIYRDPTRRARLYGLLRRHETALRDSLSVAGIVMIGVSLACVTPANWPGTQTVLPVLGTAMVILAGPQARGNALLGGRPLPFVGGISYPLYLWHWPLIVYSRMLDVPRGDLLAVGLAVVLAWITKEFIEGPARFGRLFGVGVWRPGLGLLCTGLLMTGALGLTSLACDGYPSRIPPGLNAIARWSIPRADAAWRLDRCYFHPGQNQNFASECTPPKRAGMPRILLWGDSHAAHLYPGLVELRKGSDFDLVQWTAAGCPPTLASWSVEQKGCQERRTWILAQMPALAPDTVIMAARWDLYLSLGITRDNIVRAVGDDVVWLRSLGVQRIVVFGPGPAWNASLPTDLFRYMSLRRTERVPERLGTVPESVWHLDEVLGAQAAARGAQYVSVLSWFCNPAGCRTLGDESEYHPDLLFRDQDHLTPSGSRNLMKAAAAKILVPSPGSMSTRNAPG
jgi:peptidoglycan/LPS O-acetylase OafA/YrhL